MLPVGDLFQSYRPHIAVACADSIYVLKLTVRHETNMIHSHDYKKARLLYFIEVSTLGFIADISDFTKALKKSDDA